jgi:serine/threonine protein kinase
MCSDLLDCSLSFLQVVHIYLFTLPVHSFWLICCCHRNINWTAPEVLVNNGESVCEKADVWSLAVVCSEILSGEIPFDSEQCRRMTMEHFVDAIANNLRPSLPNNINLRLRSAVSRSYSYR